MTEKEIEKLRSMTVLELAQILEDGLIHSGLLREDVSVLEFIKDYINQ